MSRGGPWIVATGSSAIRFWSLGRRPGGSWPTPRSSTTGGSTSSGSFNLIDGSIGEGSRFDETFGYYAHGVSAQTACLPDDWENRAARIDIAPDAVCLLPDEDDIALAKLCAWRDKDRAWILASLSTGLLDLDEARSARLPHSNAPPSTEIGRRFDQLRPSAHG